MEKGKFRRRIIIFAAVLILLLVLIAMTDAPDSSENLSEVMNDAILHDTNKISLFGLIDVNPSFISGICVTVILLIAAALIRVLVIPKFTDVPGKFQMLLEALVGFFDGLVKKNSPHKNGFLGAYIFSAGVYIFAGTIFELFGVQAVTTEGMSISLPAVLSDINAAICLGVLSYLIILSGGIAANGFSGALNVLKDFSLMISMSFRLFGALISGVLVTELVYYAIQLSFVLPVLVAVLFTLIHAVVQTYVLTMLTSFFYGEATHPKAPKKKRKAKKSREIADT
ncbi:MAG: F0F1 ATP synthase subunit A [Firmicutes bacterium]|nr:F0F1 ATP synthase subunit A [Bacillota bacterium]